MNRIRRALAGLAFGAAIAWLLEAIVDRIRGILARLEAERELELGLAFPNEWGIRTTPLDRREVASAIVAERWAIAAAADAVGSPQPAPAVVPNHGGRPA